MAQWRIRVNVPEAPSGRQRLTSALAGVPVSGMRLDPPDDDSTEATGDVIVELAGDDALEDLLRTLHEISPQVLISRVPTAGPGDGRPIRVRKLAPGAIRQ